MKKLWARKASTENFTMIHWLNWWRKKWKFFVGFLLILKIIKLGRFTCEIHGGESVCYINHNQKFNKISQFLTKGNKLLFMSSAEDPELPEIVKIPGEDGRIHLWKKTQQVYRYVSEFVWIIWANITNFNDCRFMKITWTITIGSCVQTMISNGSFWNSQEQNASRFCFIRSKWLTLSVHRSIENCDFLLSQLLML